MSAERPNRPNVLFLMTDEHRFDVLGFTGNHIVRTPTLDRLAKSGTVFSNAYTPSPACIPARQSMMAGQLPHTTGCIEYGQDLPPGYNTWARVLSQHGYETVACGKLHHLGTDQMQGWTTRIGSEMMLGKAFIDGKAANFDHYAGDHRTQIWDQAKEVQRAAIGRGPYAVRDEYAVQGACDFIEEYFASPTYDRASPERPVALKISLTQPHYPYLADAERFSYYLNRVPIHTDAETADHPDLVPRAQRARCGIEVSEREIRRATAAYYAMIEATDHLFGKVVTALEHVGQDLDDWIVVFTSDHGEMLGERGLWAKRAFFDPSAKVPLFIRAPHHDNPGLVEENVNLCDLFATLCELTGLPTPGGLDSRSLVPLMDGNGDGWDDESISQYGSDQVMIKWGSLKYQYYGDNLPEIVSDLHKDPAERINLAADPVYAELLGRFRKRRTEIACAR